ncbi:MAG: class I SAM-dependent methyltransferase [Chloroflexota bacterium]|nr:class I SAM-dependent methyltransferase [Chloroflexota bacterium]PLS80825.1 MAG: SAM-dependent methyltransferase [Chloroflexota bacterium]
MIDPTRRFSSRVDNYIKYRPGYPPALIDLLAGECQLTPASIIADVGSGTGILSELFLKHGNLVYGIEPNPEMRAAGEQLLSDYPRFHSLAAPAEATSLPPGSVDFVTAGQAFHWFDQARARAEFLRILRPHGWAVLIWNDRRTLSAPFQAAYEQMLQRYASDYPLVNHKQVDDEVIAPFFGAGGYRRHCFDNLQRFDYAGLKGRLLSSSYAPEAGHPNHAPMLAELERIFEAHQADGQIVFEYDTTVYYGQLR